MILSWSSSRRGSTPRKAIESALCPPPACCLFGLVFLTRLRPDSGDPEGELSLTPEGYAYLTARLMTLAHGRCVLALEGGYNIPAVKWCLASCVATLLGAPGPERRQLGEACGPAIAAIEETMAAQRPYWQCL